MAEVQTIVEEATRNGEDTVRRLTVLLIGVAMLAVLGKPGLAQTANPRGGFWWGLGLSYGWVHVSCDICIADREAALSATIYLGGTISRSVLLGGELNGWTRSEEAVDEYLGSFSAVAYWYPTGDGAFYLKGGLAYMAYRIDDDEDALTSSGFGPQIGAGYQFRVSRHASVQPYLNAIMTVPTANLDINGNRQADGVSLSLLQFGLGFTWH